MADNEPKQNAVTELPQGKKEGANATQMPVKPFEPGNEEWKKRKNYGTPHFGPLFRAALQKIVLTKDGQQITWEQAIISKAVAMAANGDNKMLNTILDRVEGKPKTTIEFEPTEAGTVVLTPEQEARIERLFGFKTIAQAGAKVVVHPIATAPVPKPIGNVKPPIAPGRLVIANPKAPSKTVETKNISFTIKK